MKQIDLSQIKHAFSRFRATAHLSKQMSLGIFRSIRRSFGSAFRRRADKLLRLLNDELR